MLANWVSAFVMLALLGLAFSQTQSVQLNGKMGTATISGVINVPSSALQCTDECPIHIVTEKELDVVENEVEQLRKKMDHKLEKEEKALKRAQKTHRRLRREEVRDYNTIVTSNKIISNIKSKISSTFAKASIPKRGRPGPRGRKGPRGYRGPPGAAGLTGAPGRSGPIGANGPAGPEGSLGQRGPRGQEGDIGSRGRPGPNGRTGRTGSIGYTGPAGRPGADGRPGPPGGVGRVGPRGDRGPAGRRGQTGPRGNRGPSGPRGPRGNIGRTGRAGPPGANGRNGNRGPPGPSGRNGAAIQGPPGHAGPTGKDAQRPVVAEEQEEVLPAMRPIWKVMEKTTSFSWRDLVGVCESNGLSMCNLVELCPRGPEKMSRFNAKLPGNQWVAYSGAGANAWVQLGFASKICVPHQDLNNGEFGRPQWGLRDDREAHRGPLYCCGQKPLISKEIVNIGYSYAYSWDDYKKACDQNGLQMANFMSICPKGPGLAPFNGPARDQPNNDCWIPIGGEEEDAWLQTAAGHWGTCNRHTEIQGGVHGRPSWGRVRDRGGHHGPMYCTGKPTKKTPVKMSIGSKGWNWDQAASVCRGNEMNLCNFMSLCPEGHISAPQMGRQDGDVWIPFLEGENAWVQIGRQWPQCFRHSEIPGGLSGGPWGRPGWGEDESRHHFKGPVYCCGTKPAPRAFVESGSSQGKTWEEASLVCERRRKGLCRMTDICPDGPNTAPAMGVKQGDVWTPMGGEIGNTWVQIGNAGWPSCLRHNEIQNGAHGRPGWGNDRSAHAYKGPIYCC